MLFTKEIPMKKSKNRFCSLWFSATRYNPKSTDRTITASIDEKNTIPERNIDSKKVSNSIAIPIKKHIMYFMNLGLLLEI